MQSPSIPANLFLLSIFVALSGMLQCQGESSALKYYLAKPRIIELARALKEISGIAVSDNRLFAISDDEGQVFQLNLNDGTITRQWTFGEANDYEDVATVSGRFFVLSSNGDLVSFSLPTTGSPVIDKFEFPFGKGVEFETLYYDKQAARLVMICKECKADGASQLSAYTFDPATGNYKPATFSINAEEARQKSTRKQNRLKPSAAAIHPITGEVYMISSINKLIIRMSLKGRIISVHPIKRADFEQPEGITFTANGDMLISNEAGENEQATLLLFKYNPN